MKNLQMILALGIILLFISCQSNNKIFEGTWLNNKTRGPLLIIQKQEDKFLVTFQNKKYPANLTENNLLEIHSNPVTKAAIDSNNFLIFEGEAYQKYDLTNIHKFLGPWEYKSPESEKYPFAARIKIGPDSTTGKNHLWYKNGSVDDSGKISYRNDYYHGAFNKKFLRLEENIIIFSQAAQGAVIPYEESRYTVVGDSLHYESYDENGNSIGIMSYYRIKYIQH